MLSMVIAMARGAELIAPTGQFEGQGQKGD